MKKLLRKLKCRCGLHEWVSDGEVIPSTTGKGEIALIWWNCKHCWETRLKCLLR